MSTEVFTAEEKKVFELLRLFDSFRSSTEQGSTVSDSSSSCHCNSDAALREADSRHRQHLLELASAAGNSYSDDGDPVLFAFLGAGENKICGYRWEDPSVRGSRNSEKISESPYPATHIIRWSKTYTQINWSKVRGVVIHAHGITESARTGLLRCKATSLALGERDHLFIEELTHDQQILIKQKVENDNGYYVAYGKSWVDAITHAGFVLYTIDHQGHGYSQGWKGEQCNVERLLNLEQDIIHLTRSLVLSGEIPQLANSARPIPIYLTGLSLGGLISLRAIQIGLNEKLLCTRNNFIDHTPIISGLGLFCPAISGERLKRKFPNQFLLPITKILNVISPSARLVALEDRRPYEFLNPMIARDPMIYGGKLPIRISAESIAEMDKILPNIDLLPEDLSILLIQSKNDTMTDPEGSDRFIKLVHCKDKTVHWLDYSWHWLAREPGYGATCQVFIDWLLARTIRP